MGKGSQHTMEKIVQYCQGYFFKAGRLSHRLARILRESDCEKARSADQEVGVTDMHISLSKILQLRFNIFIVNSLEEMTKRLEGSIDMSVGAVVLKFLEQYIYKNPEERYEWRNYPDVSISPPPMRRVEIAKSPSLMKPAFGRIS